MCERTSSAFPINGSRRNNNKWKESRRFPSARFAENPRRQIKENDIVSRILSYVSFNFSSFDAFRVYCVRYCVRSSRPCTFPAYTLAITKTRQWQKKKKKKTKTQYNRSTRFETFELKRAGSVRFA